MDLRLCRLEELAEENQRRSIQIATPVIDKTLALPLGEIEEVNLAEERLQDPALRAWLVGFSLKIEHKFT
jgi:hypothetical protein